MHQWRLTDSPSTLDTANTKRCFPKKYIRVTWNDSCGNLLKSPIDVSFLSRFKQRWIFRFSSGPQVSEPGSRARRPWAFRLSIRSRWALVGGIIPREFLSGWWLSHPLKNMKVSLGLLFPTKWTNKIHVPNHQPVIVLCLRFQSMDWNWLNKTELGTWQWLFRASQMSGVHTFHGCLITLKVS